MKELLKQYCKLNSIKIEDIEGDSRKKGISQHRHIYSFCIRKAFPHIKLWQIETTLNKAQVNYGVSNITHLLEPIIKNGKIMPDSPEVVIIKKRVKLFLAVCAKYKKSDIKVPLEK